MSFHAGTRSILLGLAALLASVFGCGARSELVIGGHEVCANGSRAGAVGCPSVAFADPVSYPVGAGSKWVLVVVDLNGDGALDIAVNLGTTVTVLLNQGHGVFSDGVPYPTSSPNPSGLSAGDLNHDGFVDLVVGTGLDAGTFVSVLLNDGHGGFAPGAVYAAGLSPTSVALGDLNGDGLLDIATANTRADSVSVLSNLGDGTFGPPVTHGPVMLPTSIAVADLDRNGRLDLAVTSAETSGLSVFLNAGGGTLAGPISYLLPPKTFVDDLAVGDVSGDGWPDFVYGRGGAGVEVRLNSADDTIFGDAASYPQTQRVEMAMGDLNGDCRLDIALVDYGKTVSVLPNLGDGTFGPATTHVVGSKPASSVAVGDLDGDGKLDLVVSYVVTGAVSVLLNRGCGP
jgi:hypothetical protein